MWAGRVAVGGGSLKSLRHSCGRVGLTSTAIKFPAVTNVGLNGRTASMASVTARGGLLPPPKAAPRIIALATAIA